MMKEAAAQRVLEESNAEVDSPRESIDREGQKQHPNNHTRRRRGDPTANQPSPTYESHTIIDGQINLQYDGVAGVKKHNTTIYGSKEIPIAILVRFCECSDRQRDGRDYGVQTSTEKPNA
jgi:hypothetical protein